MKSTLRSSAAAVAMLLASLGAVLVAQPAAAEHRYMYAQPAVAPQPVIERFVLRHAGSFEPGREVRFRLVGAPGGQVWLRIPGVLRSAEMVETRPGVYVADYVIRWRDNPDAFSRAVATLHSGGQRASARVEIRGEQGYAYDWGSRYDRDGRAPQITDLTPLHGENVGARGWTRISARFTDEGSGVDPSAITLRIDGRDVTGRARVESDEIRYREDLAPGRHVAELVVRDRAGNASRRAWSFDVVDRNYGGYGYYPGQSQPW